MKKALLGSAVLLLFAGQLHAENILYSQAPVPNPPGGVAVQGSASLTDDIGEFFRAYDNFSLPFNASVKRINWFGQYAEIGGGTDANDFSNIDRAVNGFDIRFYDSAGGAPGSLISSQVIPFANAGETFIANAGDPTMGVGTGIEFNSYSGFLPSEVFLSGNTEYWLAIAGQLAGDANGWDWHDGATGLPGALSDFDLTGDGVVALGEDRATIPDLAFQLDGVEVVPEPASMLAWLVGGAVGLAFAGRRRMRRRK